jgi:uncharacterized protein (TIGR02594 family)
MTPRIADSLALDLTHNPARGFGTGSAFSGLLNGIMSEPAWLVRARTFIGFHETGDNRGIEQFISEAKTGSIGDSWCAIFANAMLESAGVLGTRSPAARSFEHNANFSRTHPIVGCIVTLWRISPDSGKGHVGFFLGQDANNVQLLSGNDDDQVEIADHPRSRVTGYWWPNAVTIPAQSSTDATVSSGRGSWYSQFTGKSKWVDPGDKPNSNALGVPDWAQGCAFFDRSTLGHWFVVTAPNGISLLMPQTDVGPSPNTHRKIDISAHMAEAFGYSRTDFPTDGIFKWVPAAPPAGLEHLTPRQQAIQWAKEGADHFPPPTPNGADDTPFKPPPKDNLMLLMLLLMLSKEKLMSDDPAKVLLPLLLRSALNGRQIDISDLLSGLLTGKPGAGAAQPADMNTLLTQLLYREMNGNPRPAATPPGEFGISETTPTRPENSAMSKPSVQLSVTGLATTAILQALGIVGTPFGMGQYPTDIGTLATLVPIATGAIGATGGFGALANIALRLFSGFRRQPA